MWIVFEMEGTGLTDEVSKVIGPFESREAAEAYCARDDLDAVDGRGVMQVEAPARRCGYAWPDAASLFVYVASADDIEYERQRLEARYKQKLAVHEITYPTHSGTRCTRVTWQVL